MPSRREQHRLQVLVEFTGDTSNLNKSMNQLKRKIRDTVGKDASVKTFSGSSDKDISLLQEQTKETYSLADANIRGRTAAGSLRHEVGRLRNILLLVSFATGGVIASFKSFFEQTVRTEASLNSLRSVASNTGLEFDRLRNQSIALENEGIMSIGGSTAALKNLAASRISLTETTQVMNALTDAAAFNRQGTLSWEEAVLGATQGIKNQNSIMIDNAGITKNVSVIYKEYALQLGKTAGKLTENEKRQAIVNGIIKEAGIFAGDAERAMNSYQGQISKFNTQILKIQRTFGDIVAPGVIEIMEKISQFLNDAGSFDTIKSSIKFILGLFSDLVDLTFTFAKLISELSKGLNQFVDFFDSLTLGSSKFIGNILAATSKFTIFVSLAALAERYFNGIATRLNNISSSKLFAETKSGLLQQSAAMSLGLNRFSSKDSTAIQQKISQELLKEKDVRGSINEFLKQNLNNRIRELNFQAQTNAAAKIELEILKNKAKLLGFNITQSKNALNKASIGQVILPGEKPSKGQVIVQEGLIDQESRKMLSNLGKWKLAMAEFKTSVKAGFNEMKLGTLTLGQSFSQLGKGIKEKLQGNVTPAIRSINTEIQNIKMDPDAIYQQKYEQFRKQARSLAAKRVAEFGKVTSAPVFERYVKSLILADLNTKKVAQSTKLVNLRTIEWSKSLKLVTAGFVTVGRAALSALSSIFSAVIRLFGWFTYILIIYQTIKGFFDEADQKAKILEQARKNLELERKSLTELTRITAQTENKLFSQNSNILTLMTRNGQNLGQINKDMRDNLVTLNEELDKYNQLIKDRADEEVLSTQLEKINDLRGKQNELLNIHNQTWESYNETLEKTQELFKGMSLSNSGIFSEIFNEFFKLQERLEENRSELLNRLAITIPEGLGRLLGLTEGQYNSYYLAIQIAEQEHQFKMQKIRLDSERKISEIQKQIRQERLKGLRQSLLTELLEIQTAFENQKDQILNQIKDLQMDKTTAQFSSNIMQVFLSMMNQQLDNTLKESKKNIILYLDDIKKLDFSSSLEDILKSSFNRLKDIGTFSEDETFDDPSILLKSFKALNTEIKIEGQKVSGSFDELLSNLFNKLGSKIKEIEGQKLLNLDEFIQLEPKQQEESIKFFNTYIESIENLKGELGSFFIEVQKNKTRILPGHLTILEKIFKNVDYELNTYLKSLNLLINETQTYAKVSEKMNLDTKLQSDLNNQISETTANFNQILASLNEQLAAVGETLPKQLTEAIRKVSDYSDLEIKLNSIRNATINGLLLYGDSLRSLSEIQRNSRTENEIWIDNLEKSKIELLDLAKRYPSLNREIEYFLELIEKVPDALETKTAKNLQIEIFKTFKNTRDSLLDISVEMSNLQKGLNLDTSSIHDLNLAVQNGGVDLELYSKSMNHLSAEIAKLSYNLDNLETNEDKLAAFNNAIYSFIIEHKKNINDLILSNREFERAVQFEGLQVEARVNAPFLNMFFGEEGRFQQIENERIANINAVQDKIRSVAVTGAQEIQEITRKMTLANIHESLAGISELQSNIAIEIDLLQDNIQTINKDSLNKQKEAWFDFFNSVFSGFSQIFANLGDVIFKHIPTIYQEQEKALQDQNKLLRQGEISQLEHGRRVAEINKFYAKQINQAWTQAMGSIASSILQMMSQVFQSLAAAQAVKAVGEEAFNLGSIVAGIGAAAPWLAVAGGLAFAGAALSNVGNENLQFPEFESPDATQGKFGGTIKAEEVEIHISPTFIIEGEQIFIGSGSVVEYVNEATELMKQSIQDALDNREINLDKIKRV